MMLQVSYGPATQMKSHSRGIGASVRCFANDYLESPDITVDPN